MCLRIGICGQVFVPHSQARAGGNLERALGMSREIGDPGMEASAHNGFGDLLLQTGHADKACAHHAAALRLASQTGLPREQARAHSGLARACQAGGDSGAAWYHWQEALSRYTAIGAPEASEILSRLATADYDHIS